MLQNDVIHGVGYRQTSANQGLAGGGHLPSEPGQQGTAAPQLGLVHHVRGGGVRVLDGRGRVHARTAVQAHRLVRGRRLLATSRPRVAQQRRPVRDRGVRQTVQGRVPVQPPGEHERRVRHGFRLPSPAAAVVPRIRSRHRRRSVHLAVVVFVVRQKISIATVSVLILRSYCTPLLVKAPGTVRDDYFTGR